MIVGNALPFGFAETEASGCESRRVSGAAKDVSSDGIGRIGIELARRRDRDGPATDAEAEDSIVVDTLFSYGKMKG